MKNWLNNNMSICWIDWRKIWFHLNLNLKIWRILSNKRTIWLLNNLNTREKLNKIEFKPKWSLNKLLCKSIKIKWKEEKELVLWINLWPINLKLFREELPELDINKKSQRWQLIKIRIKMKLKCNINSLFIVFSLSSWQEKWRTKWKIMHKSNKLSKISELPQVFLTLMKSYKISWLESKLTHIYLCKFLTTKEKSTNWELITSNKPKDSTSSKWKTRKTKALPKKPATEMTETIMDSMTKRLMILMQKSKFSLKKKNKPTSSTRKLTL